MRRIDSVQAWKEYQHRVSLIGEDLAPLPQDSSAMLELTETELMAVSAGWRGRYDEHGWGDRDDYGFGGWGDRDDRRYRGWGDYDDRRYGRRFGCGY